jgi:hypothetical protein
MGLPKAGPNAAAARKGPAAPENKERRKKRTARPLRDTAPFSDAQNIPCASHQPRRLPFS